MSRLWKMILKNIEAGEELLFLEGYLKNFDLWEDFCSLKKSVSFLPETIAKKITCPGCEQECFREVVHKQSGYYVYCDQGITNRVKIEPDDLRQWKFETFVLIYYLHNKLQLKDDVKDIEKNLVWRLGSYKFKNKFFVLYFARSSDLIENYKNKNVVFLVPFLPDDKMAEMEEFPVISLLDFLKLDSDGLNLDHSQFHYFLEASLEKVDIEQEEDNLFPEYFKFAEDYRNITYKDKNFKLTKKQGAIIGHLIEKYQVGEKSITQEEILKAANSKSLKIKDLFKNNEESKEAYKTLIRKTKIKDMFSLNFD